MFIDKHLELGAQGARKQHAGQQQHGAAQVGHLHQGPPGAAEIAQIIGAGRHRQQVDGRTEQGGRAEQHLARHRQAQRPARIARRRHGQERRAQRIDDAARGPDIVIDLAKQQRVAVQVKIIGKQAAHAQARKLDAPALERRRVAVPLLHQQHAEHRQQQPAGDGGGARKRGLAGIELRQGRPPQHQADRRHASCRPPPGPAGARATARSSSSRNTSQARVRSNSRPSPNSDQRRSSSTSTTTPVAHAPVTRQAASKARACRRARQLLISKRESRKNASEATPWLSAAASATASRTGSELTGYPCRKAPLAPFPAGSAGRGTGCCFSHNTDRIAAS